MESMEKRYNRLFQVTVLCVCAAVMIIALRTRPVCAMDQESVLCSQTEIGMCE